MSFHATIDTYPALHPSSPPRASAAFDATGRIHVDVEDVGDPEVEAIAAARAILEYFLGQHAETR